MPNLKVIAPVVAEIAILGVVGRWPKGVVIELYCFRPHPNMTTIVVRSRAKFEGHTYNSSACRSILVRFRT